MTEKEIANDHIKERNADILCTEFSCLAFLAFWVAIKMAGSRGSLWLEQSFGLTRTADRSL